MLYFIVSGILKQALFSILELIVILNLFKFIPVLAVIIYIIILYCFWYILIKYKTFFNLNILVITLLTLLWPLIDVIIIYNSVVKYYKRVG